MSRSSSLRSEGRRVAPLPSLPDSALIAVFSGFSMSDRLQHLSLVCKRWRELCTTPILPSKVATAKASGGEALPRLRSLLLWLARHASKVEELSLTVGELTGDTSEVLQLIASAAVSCGPQLRQFSLRLEGQQQPPLVLSSWLCCLLRLTRLDASAQHLQVSSSLASLTGLQTLSLRGLALIQCPAGRWMPPGLTCLHWSCGGASSLPEQVTGLTSLQQLSLTQVHRDNVAGSLDVLTRLAPSVTGLQLSGALEAVPAQLAALGGQLSTLRLASAALGAVDAGGVAGLTNLTMLKLHVSRAVAPAPSLQQLTRLQQLFICNGPYDVPAPAAAAPPAPANQPVLRSLPAGAWLGSLTHLALSYDVLFGSLGVLPTATRLKSLHILRLQCMPAAPPPGEPPHRWAALCEWLCTHPPLRCLTLVCWTSVRAELLDLLLALAERRPGLAVERRRSVDGF